MHELSIALSIIEMAEEESKRQGGAKVNAFTSKLGPLSGVVKTALESAFGLACKGRFSKEHSSWSKEFRFVGYCPKCLAERTMTSMQWFACPECESPISEVTHG